MNKSIHLGTVTESLKFIQGKAYHICLLPSNKIGIPTRLGFERTGLLPSTRKGEHCLQWRCAEPVCMATCGLWKKLPEKTKIREDLEKVFRGNKGRKVDDVMTLAISHIFPAILTTGSLMAKIHQTPSTCAKYLRETSPVLRSQSLRRPPGLVAFVQKELERWSSVLLTHLTGQSTGEQPGRRWGHNKGLPWHADE